jgi:hypothetical protein
LPNTRLSVFSERMKASSLLLAALFLVTLTSCYITPVSPRARSPYSPGGRYVTPRETLPHSRYSLGGVVVLPREARRVYHHGTPYYRHGNIWYRSHGHGYVICPRPY